MQAKRVVAAALAAVLLGGCSAGGPEPAASGSPSGSATVTPTVTPTPIPTPTPTATATALRSGPRSSRCVNGWREPAPGTPLRQRPLDLLRNSQSFTGTFRVVELRYFTGPDDANLSPESKQRNPVERWYGSVVYNQDPTFKIRFIAVRRNVGEGIVAVAPYGTTGFRRGDWYGFDGEGGRSRYPRVPGRWPGQPVDYVAAGELPPQVTGCLVQDTK